MYVDNILNKEKKALSVFWSNFAHIFIHHKKMELIYFQG